MEDMNYLAFNKRPALAADLSEMSHISALLATSSKDRSRFMSDPRTYLAEMSIHVDECKMRNPKFTKTTEACTAAAWCNAYLALNALMFVNVAAGVTVYDRVYLWE